MLRPMGTFGWMLAAALLLSRVGAQGARDDGARQDLGIDRTITLWDMPTAKQADK